ncbi:MAG: FtsX-like permease family protein [Saprospiraceae bacterium]|nr:FtsX-like permease family protein [Saprospiraceae bacterium]
MKNKLLINIELKLNETHNSTIVHELQTIMGNDFQVKDRSKQDESFIKIMKLEKWLFFALFSLTLVIVCFTLIGTIWMIVLEKKMDISILKSLGMQESDVKSIFIRLGLLLTLIGIALGFILALIFYWMQKQYGIVGVPEEFIIDSYPISISIWDFLIVFITVFSIGFIASILPAQKIQSIPTIFREE